jgi:hypothetical protein
MRRGVPSRTTHWSGRPTAQALWVIPGFFRCGPQLSGSVRRRTSLLPISAELLIRCLSRLFGSEKGDKLCQKEDI